MKKLLLKSILLLCTLIVGTSAWAADTKVSFTSLGTKTWTNYSLTSGAVTISTNLNNGSAPTTNNAQYRWKTNNIITISTSTGTLKSIQFKTNSTATYGPQCLNYNSSAITNSGTDYTWNAPSGINSANFTVTSECRLTEIHVTYTTSSGGGSSVTAPTFDPGAGAIAAGSTVTLLHADADAIRYTTDGTEPTKTTGNVYSSPITITTATTIKAIAVKGENVSDVATASYTITVAYPAFNLNSGSYFQGTEITLTSTGNTIYYNITTNGSDPGNPTNASTEYTAPIVLGSGTTKIKAIAYDAYGNKSTVTDRTYTGVAPTTLPFTFDGGRDDIETTAGLIYSGLGGDYKSKPYLKFDSQGDYLILKAIGTLPDELEFDIKGNSLSGTYAFKVQWSANGVDFTDLATYTSINSDKETKTIDISSCTGLEYIKWIYATRDAGNVALGNINVTPQTEEVTIGANKYSTYCSTNALTFANTDVKAYKAKVDGGNVVLTQVDEVPANTGVILFFETAGDYDIPLASGTPAAVTENELIGVTTKTEVTWESDGKFNYILQSGQFKKAKSSGGYLKANRAYLHTSYEVTGARDYLEFSFEGEEETTGVNEVTTTNLKNNTNEYFNLAGQKVLNPTKGLYIVNGKKVMVK